MTAVMPCLAASSMPSRKGKKASDASTDPLMGNCARIKGSVLASDAFFPFRDGIDEAAKHGITAVIQPGGSVRDGEVIDAASAHAVAMVLTGVRHFNHWAIVGFAAHSLRLPSAFPHTCASHQCTSKFEGP